MNRRPRKAIDVTELPWMRVQTPHYTFAVAVLNGRVVGGAPLGMKIAKAFNYDAREMWKHYKRFGESVERLEP